MKEKVIYKDKDISITKLIVKNHPYCDGCAGIGCENMCGEDEMATF